MIGTLNSIARVSIGVLLIALLPTANATQESVDELIHTTLMLDAHPDHGQVVYRTRCARCHGEKGAGNKKGMPALAGQRVAYLVKQFGDFLERDRDDQMMHRVIGGNALNDPQTWIDLATYINSIPPASSVEKGNGRQVQLGEAIFREQCSSCHEEDARGDDDGFVPSLRNQHYTYLLRQMHALADNHRRNVDPDLDRFLASVKDDEMQATADYLSRLRTRTKDRLIMRSNGVTSD